MVRDDLVYYPDGAPLTVSGPDGSSRHLTEDNFIGLFEPARN
jgi:hypothetical protein